MGVLLPLSGPEGQPLYDAITLARDQINAGGGIGGRPLELILRDTRLGDIMTYADYFVRDPRIGWLSAHILQMKSFRYQKYS